MNELITLIKTVVTNEIEPDKGVKADGFILDPYMDSPALNGDGKIQEVVTSYQLDIFYEAKGKLMSKAQALLATLEDYQTSSFVYTYETNARLWRGTITINTI